MEAAGAVETRFAREVAAAEILIFLKAEAGYDGLHAMALCCGWPNGDYFMRYLHS